MTKIVALALVVVACGGGSSGMPGDDAPTPDAPPKDPSTRAWTFMPLGNGKSPNYALSPSGTLAVSTNDDLAVIRIHLSDGTMLGSPNGPQANHEGVYGIAYDKDSALHLFFRGWGKPAIEHWVHRGTWQPLPSLTTAGSLVVANGANGQISALLTEETGSLVKLSLVTFDAAGVITAETIDSIDEASKITFAVGRDGNPAIAWGRTDADAYPQYMHRGSTGWRRTQLGPDLVRLPNISIAAGDLATVFIDAWDTKYLSQETFTTWTTPIKTTQIGPYIATTTDAYGIVHTCTGNKHGQLVNGMLAVTQLDDGGGECWLGTDATGRLHMAFHIGEVIKRGVFE